jgi:uncharacterized protein involved in type VI secretion and phage assembly
VPAISDHDLTWAEPCTPYAGPKLGWYAMPPIGANVWIEFEGGDANYPIWAGCFWGADEVPPDAADPDIKVFQTEKMKLVLDDKAVQLSALVETDNGRMSLVMDKNGIVVTAASHDHGNARQDRIERRRDMMADAITLKQAASITPRQHRVRMRRHGWSRRRSI